jgi:hypothetical protein
LPLLLQSVSVTKQASGLGSRRFGKTSITLYH